MTSALRALCLLLVVFTGRAWAAAPTIANAKGVATGVSTAVFSALITGDNDSRVTVTVLYGTTKAYGERTNPTTVTGGGSGASVTVSIPVSGLTSGLTYHFKVTAVAEGGSAETGDLTFLQSIVTLSAVQHNATTGVITLNGVVAPNGIAGTAVFEYSENEDFLPLLTVPAAPVSVLGTETSVTVSAALPGDLRLGPVYRFRLVFNPTSGTPARIESTNGRTNANPKAVADIETLPDAEPLTISVLGNDTDAESDVLTISAVTKPRFGTAAISADKKTVIYTPTQALLAADTFRYTIEDGFTGKATAQVTIRPLREVLAGAHGGLIRDSEGREIGYFRITATQLGSFTGVVVIDGKSYPLVGSFAADGSFRGAASRDGTLMPVEVTTVLGDTGTTIQAEFAQGKYTAEVEFSDDEAATRGPLAGRYTVALPGSGGSTGDGDPGNTGTDTTTNALPEGTGWAALKVGADGSVRVKGRLPDGRSISTRGMLGVGADGPQITFYDDPSETRVVGTFTVGDAITGSLRVDRAPSDDDVFGGGYDTTLTANGARYLPPGDDVDLLAGTNRLTINFSGGDLPASFSRNLEITGRNKLAVIDGGREDVKVKLDKSSGRFQTKMTVEDDGPRIKGTGVIVQPTADGSGGSGGGVFKGRGQAKTGRIQITAGSTPTPATPVPTPTPATPAATPIALRAVR